MDAYNKLRPLSEEKSLCKLGGIFFGENRGRCKTMSKCVEFKMHKAELWGEMRDETGKVFWGHIWSRA